MKKLELGAKARILAAAIAVLGVGGLRCGAASDTGTGTDPISAQGMAHGKGLTDGGRIHDDDGGIDADEDGGEAPEPVESDQDGGNENEDSGGGKHARDGGAH